MLCIHTADTGSAMSVIISLDLEHVYLMVRFIQAIPASVVPVLIREGDFLSPDLYIRKAFELFDVVSRASCSSIKDAALSRLLKSTPCSIPSPMRR